MTTATDKFNDIKEVFGLYTELNCELNIRIEDYIKSVLRKFNDEFIEFDSEQKRLMAYHCFNNVMTLTSIQLVNDNIVLCVEDEYASVYEANLSNISMKNRIDIVEHINDYLVRYGYKNTNDEDFNLN